MFFSYIHETIKHVWAEAGAEPCARKANKTLERHAKSVSNKEEMSGSKD